MKNKADIVIIGAGMSGCSIAYNLAKRGAKNIVVLEKSFICSGSRRLRRGLPDAVGHRDELPHVQVLHGVL